MRARLKTPPPARDWYWTASPEARREYDAFGPWIGEVREAADMPPCFRFAWPEQRDARFLIKVPIAADRRDVRPGMDLYRLLLAVHDDRIVVYRRVGDGIDTRTLVWDEIAALCHFTNLLVGRWSLLLLSGDTVTIDYNTVSAQRFDQLSAFVRQRLVPGTESPTPAPAEAGASVTSADPFYENMRRSVGAATVHEVAPLHFEPRGQPCRGDRIWFGLSNGLLVLDAGEELVVIDRGAPVRHVFLPTYAARTVFIPIDRLTAFALAPPARTGGGRFSTLVLVAGQMELKRLCLSSPDAVATCLEGWGIHRVAHDATEGARRMGTIAV